MKCISDKTYTTPDNQINIVNNNAKLLVCIACFLLQNHFIF